MIKRVALRLLLFFGIFLLILIGNLVIFNIMASNITEGEPIGNRSPDRVALLVIDIQEGTTGSASATDSYIRQSDSLITRVNQLAEMAVAQGWNIIWVRSEVVNPLINMLNNTLAKGSTGAMLDRRLHSDMGQVLVKRRNDSFDHTPLDSMLETMGVGHLVIAGLDAEHCVHSAIRAAANRGYALTVYEETIIAEEMEVLDKMLGVYREMGVEIRSME